jgi:Xaa-Pro dipeptidase
MDLPTAAPAATPVASRTTRLAPEVFDRIHERIRGRIAEEGLDAIITDDPEDVAYLTGFFHHPGERPVAVWLGAGGSSGAGSGSAADGSVVLLTPELERENALRQNAHARVVSFPEFPGVIPPFTHLAVAVAEGITSRRGPAASARPLRVGFTIRMTHERLTAVKRAFGAAGAFGDIEFVPTALVIEARYHKFDEEVELHREAARVTDLMLEAGVALVRDAIASGGVLPSESELTSHVTGFGARTMYAEHSDVVVVSPLAGGLVYAGANSAFPHGLPSAYRLQPGDTFMLSLGCAVGGRFVEGERTFVLGEPSADQRRYHNAVFEAQAVGGQAIRAGMECRAVNEICLNVIRDAGLGQFLRHRQGHGIGLGMHEPPYLEDGDPTVLAPGMIMSNEPGIYIPGHAGYRISDSVLVTEHGAEALTSFPRSLDDCVIHL